MDTMRPAALLSWERAWADGAVVRGKARQLARVRQWQAGGGGAVEGGRHPRLRAGGGVAVARL